MIRINLIPPEERGKGRGGVDWLRVAAIGAWGFTALLILVTVFNARAAGLYRRELDALQPRIIQLQAAQRELRDVRQHNAQLEQEKNRLEALAAGSAAVSSRLETVARILPRDVWLERLALAPGEQVVLQGYTANVSSVSRLLRSLRELGDVEDVELVALDRIGDEDPYLRALVIRLQLKGGAR